VTLEESAAAARVIILAFLTQISPELTVGAVVEALEKASIELRTLN
jgi:hypothetical protein